MKLIELTVTAVFTLTVAATPGKIGYFWHLTDIHWDPNYGAKGNGCPKTESLADPSTSAPKFGVYHCDSPWALVESAAHAMLQVHDDVEFIIWTGDSLMGNMKNKMAALTNLTHLLSHVFSSHFVFPVLGHDDPEPLPDAEEPYKDLAELWKQWLPSEALVTFRKGGYYTIERKRTKLQLVALNTNLCAMEGEDPAGQWEWLEGVLNKSRSKNETVYLVGHMVPGVSENLGKSAPSPISSHHSARFLSLVRNYAGIITGQFFGHLHFDTFRIVYSDIGLPSSRMFIAPSLTPRRSNMGGPNNPGVRLYKIQLDTGQVLDYSQYFLDLSRATEPDTEAEWTLLYNFTDLYDVKEPSAEELHNIAENFTTREGQAPATGEAFIKYIRAYSVNSTSGSTNNTHSHYCAVTCLDYAEYQNCLAATPSPLAAVTEEAPLSAAPDQTRYGTTVLCLLMLLMSLHR